mgnify:CR=1 FL=1
MDMSTETPTKSPIADELSKMVLVLQLPCGRCGYALRGLAADSDCPECGEPIRLTIIEAVDPASRRLIPIQNPNTIGNAILGVVTCFFISSLLAVVAMLIHAPYSLPAPQFVRSLPVTAVVWAAAGFGAISILFLAPILKMCQREELIGCQSGLMLTVVGISMWSLSMPLADSFLVVADSWTEVKITGEHENGYLLFAMLLDTCFPVVSAGLVFSGFRKLIPRLGQRSRAFRQAQGSRQRMNDLLATLVVLLVGRTILVNSPSDSNLSIMGLIIMVMSISFIVIGLGYLLRNTIWIRRALITPPPSLSELP